jgi:hypothetical protein
MGNAIDMTGRKFGRLEVLRRANNSRHGHAKWICQCACGKETSPISGNDLRHGRTKSCGCLQRERMRDFNSRHKRILGDFFEEDFTWGLDL